MSHISPHLKSDLELQLKKQSQTGIAIEHYSRSYAFIPLPSKKFRVHIQEYAEKIEIRHSTPPTRPTPSPRGNVTRFSRAARKRMLSKIAEIRNYGKMAFITLTYPGEFVGDPTCVKRDLDVFAKAFKRRFPDAGYVWRMELKKRLSGVSKGEIAPHYHMICFNMPKSLAWGKLKISDTNIEDKSMINWLSHTWHRIVGHGGLDHLRAGTNARVVHSMRHARNYVSKYAAKVETENTEYYWTGRRWGYTGELHDEPGLLHSLTVDEFYEFRRIARAWAKSTGQKYLHQYLSAWNWLRGMDAFSIGDVVTPRLLNRIIRQARAVALDKRTEKTVESQQ